MAKVLFWNPDVKHPLFSEKIFEIFPMIEVGANRYEVDPDGDLEGIRHPITEELIQLRGPFEDYGEVHDMDLPNQDVGVPALETGTPELAVLDEEE